MNTNVHFTEASLYLSYNLICLPDLLLPEYAVRGAAFS